MSEQEEWRPIPGFPGYFVSNQGRVASQRQRTPRVLSPYTVSGGYSRVRLSPSGAEAAKRSVHQLVLEAFVGPRPLGMVTRHLDGDPTNNTLGNLAWGTPSENAQDAVRHGTHNNASAKKTHCREGHPYDEGNTVYNKHGHRRCRVCRDVQAAAYYRRTRGAVSA